MSAAGPSMLIGALLAVALAAGNAGATRADGSQRDAVEATDPRLRHEGRRWLFAGEPLTALVIETQRDGGAAYLPIRDGWLEGIARIDYSDGTPRSRRGYIGGNKQGIQLEYWPNGQKRMEAMMDHDAAIGVSRSWRPNGVLAEEHHYVAGHEDGAQYVFSALGEVEMNYVVRGGRRYGYFNPTPCTESADLAEAR